MLSRAVTCAVLAFAALSAHAQPFPNKPIRLIAPFPPGGEIDLVARGLGQKMTESMGQPVVVENVAGAAGAIGSERVAKSAPDGYTILLGATTTHAINPALNANLAYDALKDFTPISLVTTIPHVLVVNAAVPATTLAEFVKLAKSKPGLPYGSAGNGSPHHLAGALFANLAGFEATHVPYKGVGPSIADLISGQISFMSVGVTAADPHVKSGKVRPLALAAPARLPGYDVPTYGEQGYKGFEVMAWYAVFAPAGLPPEITTRLSSEVAKGTNAPDFRERLKALGATPVGGTSQVLAAHVRTEIDRWTRAGKVANFK
ncbi:MAG: tripartite tricarboxylate transporter substrate binding protein, partial [Proteobacteria bacterium]|nr:tripartite tricarboxylate transporter substrate binding protein [Pseudomonadota bacterium]